MSGIDTGKQAWETLTIVAQGRGGTPPTPPLKDYVAELGSTLGLRGSDHGDFQSFLQITAELWTTVFRRHFSRGDVAQAMILMKQARIANTPASRGKPDDWLDVGGYAAGGWQATDKSREWAGE